MHEARADSRGWALSVVSSGEEAVVAQLVPDGNLNRSPLREFGKKKGNREAANLLLDRCDFIADCGIDAALDMDRLEEMRWDCSPKLFEIRGRASAMRAYCTVHRGRELVVILRVYTATHRGADSASQANKRLKTVEELADIAESVVESDRWIES